MVHDHQRWLTAVRSSIDGYRRMIDGTVKQLSDAELHERPGPNVNSVAVILRHIGGNLYSRWTDYLTTDGEKPDRYRDSEFQDWEGTRESLLAHLDRGWDALVQAVSSMEGSPLDQSISIRGESHSLPMAITRSLTHLSYHIGQIAIVARIVHRGDWQWLTIAPGLSEQHNQENWGPDSP